MKKYQVLNRLCKSIINGTFNDEKYRNGEKTYCGCEIRTEPLFCSYGTIGFTATLLRVEIQWDADLKELTIDGNDYQDEINLMYLEDNEITLSSTEIWNNEPRSVELETYTDAGEDMLIDLTEPTKEVLQKYIDDFDVNEEVMMWWQEGADYAHSKGVPFDNVKDHYEDYEDYLKWLQKVCNGMPY